MRMAVFPVLISFFVGLPALTDGSLNCGYKFTVEDVLGKWSCVECPVCPVGQGLTPECGSYVNYGEKIECQPCELGISYSENHDQSSCFPCGICSEHEKVAKNCTLESNSQCNHNCTRGFYFEENTGDCFPCSWCCGNDQDVVKSDCKGMPYYKQCDLVQNFKCQPRCQEDQYAKATEKGAKCIGCDDCPAGYSPSPPCGRIVDKNTDITCKACSEGSTFSDKHGTTPCKACSVCAVGQKELRPCSSTQDRLCGDCDKGFYKNGSNACKPCSACCNDNQDIHEQECAEQNMPKNKQCSFTQRAVNVCQQKNDVPTPTHKESKASIAILVAGSLVGFIILGIALMIMLRWKYRNQKTQLLYQSLSMVATEKAEGQTAVEHPVTHGSQETLSFDKSGVMIQFLDAETYLDNGEVIVVEICWDKSVCPRLQENEVQLSPVIKFHPHALKLSKAVHVKIPHSAFLLFKHGWALQLKSCTLEQGNSKAAWENQEGYIVHNNEVSFMADSLLAYVVVGTAVCPEPTKKRLQCAVFGGEGRVGVDYSAFLYVFDDCEASLEQIMQQEKVKGRILLGSLQSFHVESVGNTDIGITVQEPVHGWIVGKITPQVITHKSLKESYQAIPRVEIKFKHDNGKNRDFECSFILTGGDETITICAMASIKEDPLKGFQTRHPWHTFPQIVTGRDACEPLIISQGSPSPCFHTLQEEVFQTVCTKLDTLYRGVGNWRHVGLKLGFSDDEIQDLGKENLTPDGSPSTVMLEALKTKSPTLTVAEFVQILQTQRIERYDVVEVLQPYLYELQSCNEA